MVGQLVVIVSISQMGKDYYAKQIESEFDRYKKIHFWRSGENPKTGEIEYIEPIPEEKELLKIDEVVYPTIYKVRNRRKDDTENVVCVESVNDIPSEFDLRYTVYGSQTVAYSSKEIETLLKTGKLVILTTGSVEMAETLKTLLPNNCTTVKIAGAYLGEEGMAKVEAKRFDLDVTDEKVKTSAQKRSEFIEKNIEKLENFEADITLTNAHAIAPWLNKGKYDAKECAVEILDEVFLQAWKNQRTEQKESEILET